MATPDEDITDDLSSNGWFLENKSDASEVITSASIDTNIGATWANFVDKLIKQLSQVFRGELEIPGITPRVVADIDFAEESTFNFSGSGGSHTIAGIQWTLFNTGTADFFGITSGSGLEFDADGTNTEYTTTTRTAPGLYVTVSDLIPSWDPFGTYLIESYFPTAYVPISNNRIFVGMEFERSGTYRVIGGGARNAGGDRESFIWFDTTSNGQDNGAGGDLTHDAFAFRVSSAGFSTFSGFYNTGSNTFPTGSGYTGIGYGGQAASSVLNYMDPEARILIYFRTGTTTATAMSGTLRRLRVSKL